jgi:hypothetical protein
MSTNEETDKSRGFEFCQSLMDKCFNRGSAGEPAEKFDLKNCEQIMKQFCGVKMGHLILRHTGRKLNSVVKE